MALQRGKVSRNGPPIEIGEIRTLNRADLAVLAVPRPEKSVQTLRDSHHRVARAIASGLRGEELHSTTGYTPTRVSMLKNDPAFQELVAHYRAIVTQEWKEAADPVVELLGSIRTKALGMIEDKIEAAAENGEFLPSRDLATFAELGLDRTGYGKVNKNVNVNVDFAAQLEAARKRSASARTIEATASPTLAPQSPPRDESSQSQPVVASPSSLRRL